MNVRSDPTSQIAACNGSQPLRFSKNGFKNGSEFAELALELESKESEPCNMRIGFADELASHIEIHQARVEIVLRQRHVDQLATVLVSEAAKHLSEYERKFMNPILFFIISMLRPLRSGAS